MIARDLSENYEVNVADNNESILEELHKKFGLKTTIIDVTNFDDLRNTVEKFDLVINAVPGNMGFKVLKSVIKCQKNVVDISFFPEDPILLKDLAFEKDVTAIVDCGVAPGLCNIILGHESQRQEIESYQCFVGGLPFDKNPPFNYKAPFSPSDVIEEYTRPVRTRRTFLSAGHPVCSDRRRRVERARDA